MASAEKKLCASLRRLHGRGRKAGGGGDRGRDLRERANAPKPLTASGSDVAGALRRFEGARPRKYRLLRASRLRLQVAVERRLSELETTVVQALAEVEKSEAKLQEQLGGHRLRRDRDTGMPHDR